MKHKYLSQNNMKRDEFQDSLRLKCYFLSEFNKYWYLSNLFSMHISLGRLDIVIANY